MPHSWKGQDGLGFEQSNVAEDVPAWWRGVGLYDL